MKLIGLTGGIAMGKSTAANLLVRLGIPVLDTDVVARQLVEPGQPALAEIQGAFGADVISSNGGLDRAAIARKVFSDTLLRQKLEQILHPRIQRVWQDQADAWRVEGIAAGVVVIPLLYETNVAARFDAVVCVACSASTQQSRLLARGWSAEESSRRLQAQWPIENKVSLSDFVIWTEGIIEILSEQLRRIFIDWCPIERGV
ncbi:MAG: dephospho-CoA kinase [Verrucomicrobiota bacterium]